MSADICCDDQRITAEHEDLAHCLAKLKANAARLQREIFVLQRHIKEFQHPLFETWEADILTRLIDVAHAYQPNKMTKGIAIGLGVRSTYNPDSMKASIVSGVLDSLSSGILIYTGLVEVSLSLG